MVHRSGGMNKRDPKGKNTKSEGVAAACSVASPTLLLMRWEIWVFQKAIDLIILIVPIVLRNTMTSAAMTDAVAGEVLAFSLHEGMVK